MSVILAVFAGVIICYIGLAVYLKPVVKLFRKIRLDEEYKERIGITKIGKTSVVLIFYRVDIMIVLSGMIYVMVYHFVTIG